MNRFLLAVPVAAGLHCLLLVMPFATFKEVQPALAPVKRISVSLTSKAATRQVTKQHSAKVEKKKKEAVKPKQQAEKIKPSPLEPEIRPMAKRKAEPVKAEANQVRSAPKNLNSVAAVETGVETIKTADPAELKQQQGVTGAFIVRKAMPLYQINPPPDYPYQARRRGFEGTVVVEALISISGRVADFKLAASSGHRSLDKAAIKAVRKWRFTPGSQGGVMKEMWVRVPVSFQLK